MFENHLFAIDDLYFSLLSNNLFEIIIIILLADFLIQQFIIILKKDHCFDLIFPY